MAVRLSKTCKIPDGSTWKSHDESNQKSLGTVCRSFFECTFVVTGRGVFNSRNSDGQKRAIATTPQACALRPVAGLGEGQEAKTPGGEA